MALRILVFSVDGNVTQQRIDLFGDNNLFDFLLALAIWGALAALAYWLLFYVFKAVALRTRSEADNILLRIVRVPMFLAILGYGLVGALVSLNLDPELSLGIRRLYAAAFDALLFFTAWRVTKELLIRWLAKRALYTETNLDDLLLPIVRTLGPLVFFVVGLGFALQTLGVDIGLMLASIGAVGLIVGLAFQDTLSNLFSGVYLMIDPPFRENDLIMLPDNKVYRVEKVGLRMTQLYDMSNHALIFTPNNALTMSSIANITKPTVDVKTSAGVRSTMDADPEKVKTLLMDILHSHRNILDLPTNKLAVLRRRIEHLSLPAGAAGTVLTLSLDALEEWRRQRPSNPPAQAELLEVRKELGRCAGDVQVALRGIPARGDTGPYILSLRSIIQGAGGAKGARDAGDPNAEITAAYKGLTMLVPSVQLEPLRAALAAVQELALREQALVQQLAAGEQKAQEELNRLLADLVQAGGQVAEAFIEHSRPKESARIALWVRNVGVVYTEMEVLNTMESLNNELDELIRWLHSLEEGGLSRQERTNIRDTFRQWGGISTLQMRRLDVLRRHIMRWVEWKEEDTLPTSEYAAIVAEWDRKLALLGKKLREEAGDEEELLDAHLERTRNWVNSIYFYEPMADWKLPAAGFKGFGDTGYEYGLSYYIDDIKLNNFGRQGKVTSDLMMDIYEVFSREGIKVPVTGG